MGRQMLKRKAKKGTTQKPPPMLSRRLKLSAEVSGRSGNGGHAMRVPGDEETRVVVDVVGKGVSDKEEYECATPKSAENVIPLAVTCPPAPKKCRSRPCSAKHLSKALFHGPELESFLLALESACCSNLR